MTRTLALLLLALALSGCGASGGPSMPGYLVMITQRYPAIEGRCTGAALDATHILTAAHCVDTAQRVVTQFGQEATVEAYRVAPNADIAILTVASPLFTDKATLGVPQAGLARVLGTCPYYFPQSPRFAWYVGPVTLRLPDGKSPDYDQWQMVKHEGDNGKVCGGDSGGVLLQQGQIVGVLSAVDMEMPLIAIGTTFYSERPGEIVQ